MLVYEPFDPNIDPPSPPKRQKLYISFSYRENDKSHIYNILDTDNKNMSRKEKEIRKSILINNLLRKSTKKESIKHKRNKKIEDNDDAIVVHYLNSEDSQNVCSHYKKMSINNKNQYKRSGSESESERYNRQLNKSTDRKMRRKRSVDLGGDDEDSYSDNKTSSFEEKEKSIVKSSKKEKSNSNNIAVFYRNNDRGIYSKHSSTIESNNFLTPRQERTLDNLDTPLTIHNKYLSRVSSKFVSPNKKNINEREIIFESKEEDEDYKDNHKIKRKNYEKNLYETIDVDSENKRNINTKSLKYAIKDKRINIKASKEGLLSEDVYDDDYDKRIKNFVSFQRKNKNKKTTIKLRKRDDFSKGIQRRNISSKSVILSTRGYNEKNRKRESNLYKKQKENKNLGNMRLHNKKVNYAFTNNEYNEMNYEQALHNDNRSYLKIYIAVLIEEHIVLNTFCTDVYLELRANKLSFLVFSFEISFFLNAFFYTDEYISDTYHNNGVLNFFSSLPKSIYSFFVTLIVANLLKILSTSKKEFMKIIKEVDDKQEYLDLMQKELKKLRIKLIIYFTIIFMLGLFFLYYCSAFCAVYTNSQLFWFYGCLESLAMDLSTPFLISFVLATLRYVGLRKRIKCMFWTSDFLGFLF
jgi:hypothetical protein